MNVGEYNTSDLVKDHTNIYIFCTIFEMPEKDNVCIIPAQVQFRFWPVYGRKGMCKVLD
jgi:hypothetical protein